MSVGRNTGKGIAQEQSFQEHPDCICFIMKANVMEQCDKYIQAPETVYGKTEQELIDLCKEKGWDRDGFGLFGNPNMVKF